MSKFVRVLLASILLSMSGFSAAQTGEPERLRIHGSNVLGAQLIPMLVTDWLHRIGYSGIQRRELGHGRTDIYAHDDIGPLIVEIDGRGGTAPGIADLIADKTDIVMATRQPDAREIKAAWHSGDLTAPDQEWVVALDGLTVITAPGNPVTDLSQAQLRDIVSGRIRDWRELGGRPGPIALCIRKPNSDAFELLSGLVLGGARSSPKAGAYDTDDQIVSAIAANDNALGIIGLRALPRGVKAVALRVGSQSIYPDKVAVGSEDYPLMRRLYLYTNTMPSALGRGFVEYAITPAAQALVGRSGFASLGLDSAYDMLPDPGNREYAQIVANARRVPTAIHFSGGLDFLDSRGRQDLDRLVEFLRQPGNLRHRKVVLVGFASPNPKTPFQAILDSNDRVDSVSREMLKAGINVVVARGVGGWKNLLAPDQAAARLRNERVEVWIR